MLVTSGRAGQEFVVDAVLWLDTAPAAATDDLELTADYGAMADRLAAIVAGEPVALIETLADRLAAACLADAAVREVEITVHKPHAPVSRSSPTSPSRSAGAAMTGAGSAEQTGDVAPQRVRACVALPRGSEPRRLGLGSNLRRPAPTSSGSMCWRAAACLRAVSGVFETAPVGGPEQDDYLNAVLLAATALPARDILRLCASGRGRGRPGADGALGTPDPGRGHHRLRRRDQRRSRR